MALHLEGRAPLYLADQGVKLLVLGEVSDHSTGVANQVMVVDIIAGQICAAAPPVRVIMDALDEPHPGKQIQSTEHGGPPYPGRLLLHRFQQFGPSERRSPAV